MFFFFKQKTAYDMRISDGSSDVCSSNLVARAGAPVRTAVALEGGALGFRHHGGRPGALAEGVVAVELGHAAVVHVDVVARRDGLGGEADHLVVLQDRKSTRLNSSH